MSLYDFANGDPVNYFDPDGRVFGTPLSYGEFFGAAGSGAAQGAIAYGKGVAVGAVATGVVVLAAPVIASAGAATLIGLGVEAATATAISTATVTAGLGVGGIIGGVYTGVETVKSINAGDGDAVAYNIGNLVGGVLVAGAGGGRYIADYVGPNKSTVPVTNDPFADSGYKFVRNSELPYFQDRFNWLATAPTPSSGGTSALLIGSGASTKINKCPR